MSDSVSLPGLQHRKGTQVKLLTVEKRQQVQFIPENVFRFVERFPMENSGESRRVLLLTFAARPAPLHAASGETQTHASKAGLACANESHRSRARPQRLARASSSLSKEPVQPWVISARALINVSSSSRMTCPCGSHSTVT